MSAVATYDAVIIGAGHNGLVAANLLADKGWAVHVVEAQDVPGGAVRSSDALAPGFTTDLFSAFYPLAAASPPIRSLHLEKHGLEWSHAPRVLAHLLPDGRAAVLSRDLEETVASVDSFGAGDGAAWRRLVEQWDEIGEDMVGALLSPFPPLGHGARLWRTLGTADTLQLARMAVTPLRQFARDSFTGQGAPSLLVGNTGHSDISPVEPGSTLFGWLLCMLGQRVGFPVPRGGSGNLTAALVHRLRACGGTLECSAPAEGVIVKDGRAEGIRLADGRLLRARKAVLADVDAPTLFGELVGMDQLPGRVRRDLRRFAWDPSTLKLNWALSGPVPWTTEAVRTAGTVHLGADLDGLIDFNEDLERGRLPDKPFLVLGQLTTSDRTRSPAGTEVVWCYTHIPRRHAYDAEAIGRHIDRVEAVIERHAPGFRDLVTARLVQAPADLERANANLVGGAINGGSAKLQQELVFRPFVGLSRPETPIQGLFLAGASAHPGGGVHGGPGSNAARAALLHGRARTALAGAVVRLAARRTWGG